MYDENEQIQNIQQAARTCSNISREIYRLYTQLKEHNKITEKEAMNRALREIINPDPDFIFTGQTTDLTYFRNTKCMPFDYINNISDERLKSAVKDNFNRAARKGLIHIDPENQMIAITEKGQAFIEKSEFCKQALENTQKTLENSDKCMVLNGTETDIQIFRHKPEISIGDIINNGSSEMGSKVLSNFSLLQSKGLIDINQSGIMSLTDAGRDVLANLTQKGAALKSTAALGTVGAVIVVVKKAADVAKTLISTQTK
ncbi:MAG: hypothetical protein E7505_04290 [Ruminococcus sp.]|nr:hypothetical protein [Ruminococcus sp.]